MRVCGWVHAHVHYILCFPKSSDFSSLVSVVEINFSHDYCSYSTSSVLSNPTRTDGGGGEMDIMFWGFSPPQFCKQKQNENNHAVSYGIRWNEKRFTTFHAHSNLWMRCMYPVPSLANSEQRDIYYDCEIPLNVLHLNYCKVLLPWGTKLKDKNWISARSPLVLN